MIIEDVLNEESNDSGKNNAEAEEEDASKKETPPAEDNAGKTEKKVIRNYRPSNGEKEEGGNDVVPLKKYLEVKKALKKYKTASGSSDLNKETLEAFAEETGLTIETAKKLANIVTKRAKDEAIRAADEKIRPIVNEKISRENLEAFEADFEEKIASKYPELAKNKETFKRIAFSKEFLHLKNLEEIRQEFYPDSKQASVKTAKTETIEDGSKGGSKETETIDFSTLKDNPALYEKVMKNEKLRTKYYSWQDEQGV